MSTTNRNFRPCYTIEFKIGDLDLSSRLDKMILINSIETIYQLAFISFNIDSKDYINEKLYGQEPVTLNIVLTSEDRIPEEQTTLNLIALNPIVNLGLKQNDNQPEEQMAEKISLICILTEPFNIMATPVNKTYLKSKGDPTVPIDVIKDLVNTFTQNSQLEVKENNKNSEEYDQIQIPPMSLAKAIKYLDKDFGIFKGPYFNFCTYQENKFQLWDLSQAIKEQDAYEVIFLDRSKGCTPGRENQDDVSSTDGKTTFHTYQPINVQYGGNKSLISEGFKHKIISKPSDQLYEFINKTMDDFFEDAAKDGGSSIEKNNKVDVRTVIHNRDDVGQSADGLFVTSRMTQYLSRMSRLKFTINGNVALENLTKIGLPIKITPKVQEYIPYQGKYIVASSVLTFQREMNNNWRCSTVVRCFRGNVEI